MSAQYFHSLLHPALYLNPPTGGVKAISELKTFANSNDVNLLYCFYRWLTRNNQISPEQARAIVCHHLALRCTDASINDLVATLNSGGSLGNLAGDLGEISGGFDLDAAFGLWYYIQFWSDTGIQKETIKWDCDAMSGHVIHRFIQAIEAKAEVSIGWKDVDQLSWFRCKCTGDCPPDLPAPEPRRVLPALVWGLIFLLYRKFISLNVSQDDTTTKVAEWLKEKVAKIVKEQEMNQRNEPLQIRWEFALVDLDLIYRGSFDDLNVNHIFGSIVVSYYADFCMDVNECRPACIAGEDTHLWVKFIEALAKVRFPLGNSNDKASPSAWECPCTVHLAGFTDPNGTPLPALPSRELGRVEFNMIYLFYVKVISQGRCPNQAQEAVGDWLGFMVDKILKESKGQVQWEFALVGLKPSKDFGGSFHSKRTRLADPTSPPVLAEKWFQTFTAFSKKSLLLCDRPAGRRNESALEELYAEITKQETRSSHPKNLKFFVDGDEPAEDQDPVSEDGAFDSRKESPSVLHPEGIIMESHCSEIVTIRLPDGISTTEKLEKTEISYSAPYV
ncbi:hypothetical protein DFH09DRAFT_1327665 [Mycena vulgaris]|nr:hypothetical protein DFH09DRAFT_1327665 [Mycena vulgaris]